MSVTTDINICNLALTKIGATPISALTGTDKISVACNELYEPTRDYLLTKYNWNFAKKRKKLFNLEYVASTIAFVDSSPDTITDTGSAFVTEGFEAGMRVRVSGSANNDGTYFINTVAAATITLEADEELTAEAAGTEITLEALPAFEYDYVFELPSDFYRLWTIWSDADGNAEVNNFVLSGNKIYANEDEIYLVYISQIKTVTLFPQAFIDVLTYRLAKDLAIRVADSRTLREQMAIEEKLALTIAYRLNAIEGNPDENEKNIDKAFAWIS